MGTLYDVVDGTSAYSILSAKVSSLYGEGKVGKTSTGYWSTDSDYHVYTDWTVWYGPDDTGVVLWHVYEIYDSNNTTKSDSVYLLYGKTNTLIAMNALKSALAREELETAMQSKDLNGL